MIQATRHNKLNNPHYNKQFIHTYTIIIITNHQPMNIDSRYDNSLSDMLTLLQQAVYRFISDLQVDLNKFFLFFKQFHRNLVSLQDNFHPSKSKFSKYLTKLHALSQQLQSSSRQKTLSLQPQKPFSKTLKSKELKTQTISKMSLPHEKTEELNVIGEIEEREDFDDIRFKVKQQVAINQVTNKNRVGTAEGGRRKMSVTIDFRNDRPYTGSYRRADKGINNKSMEKGVGMVQGNQRYRSLTKYEKAVDDQSRDFQGGFTDQPSQPTQKKVYNTIGQRKTIYQLLQQEKKSRNQVQSQEQMMKAGLVKIPEKRKNRGWSRWSFKINKLL